MYSTVSKVYTKINSFTLPPSFIPFLLLSFLHSFIPSLPPSLPHSLLPPFFLHSLPPSLLIPSLLYSLHSFIPFLPPSLPHSSPASFISFLLLSFSLPHFFPPLSHISLIIAIGYHLQRLK